MFPAALPFDYIQQMDPGDRIRRTRARPSGSRMRRRTSDGLRARDAA